MNLLELMRWAAFIAWAAACFATLPAALRNLTRRRRPFDRELSLLCVVSSLLTAWGVRNVTLGPSLSGATYSVTTGLLALQIVVAAAVIHRRYDVSGWRL